MRLRRTLVTGVLLATFVVGGSGAATAASASGKGHDRCARIAHEAARAQKKLDRLSAGDGSGGHRERTEKLAARRAKLEQRIAAAQTDCRP